MRKGRVVLEDVLDPKSEQEEKERYKEIVAQSRKEAHEANLFFRDHDLQNKSMVFLTQLWQMVDKALEAKSKRNK